MTNKDIERVESEPSDEEEQDEILFRQYQDVLSGEAGRRRAVENVTEDAREREEYWRRAHERGEPIPRDYEDAPWYRW